MSVSVFGEDSETSGRRGMATEDGGNGTGQCIPPRVLLVTFSKQAQVRLEGAIRRTGLEVFSIDGRAAEAAESLRVHQAAVIVVDSSAEDVNLTQTLREVGRVHPGCLVLAVHQDRDTVSVHRDSHHFGTVVSLEAALLNQVGTLKGVGKERKGPP